MYVFTSYMTSVIKLTPPPLHTHIHSTVKLCKKGVLQTKREAFFEKMCFQIVLEKGERWRAADVCRKRVPDFSCLKVERFVSSRFYVSFGDFQQFFATGPKSSRGLVGVNRDSVGTKEQLDWLTTFPHVLGGLIVSPNKITMMI